MKSNPEEDSETGCSEHPPGQHEDPPESPRDHDDQPTPGPVDQLLLEGSYPHLLLEFVQLRISGLHLLILLPGREIMREGSAIVQRVPPILLSDRDSTLQPPLQSKGSIIGHPRVPASTPQIPELLLNPHITRLHHPIDPCPLTTADLQDQAETISQLHK